MVGDFEVTLAYQGPLKHCLEVQQDVHCHNRLIMTCEARLKPQLLQAHMAEGLEVNFERG